MAKTFETAEATLVYMTECTLATVEFMVMKKKPPTGELRRQIAIAQVGVDFIMHNKIYPSGRIGDVVRYNGGDVESWVEENRVVTG